MSNDKLAEALRDSIFVAAMLDAICETDGTVDRMKARDAARRVREALQAHAAEAAQAQAQSDDLHPATADLVGRFAAALHDKLLAAQRKYGYSDNWQRADWMDECRQHLRQHIEKGDPLDVAAYCAFLWHHGASTTAKMLTQLRVDCEAAQPASVGYVPKDVREEYEIFRDDLKRYSDGDPRFNFQALRITMASLCEVMDKWLAAAAPQPQAKKQDNFNKGIFAK